MPQTTIDHSPDDEILAQFFLDRERTADLGALVAKYSAQYPHLAAQFQDLPALQGHLSGAAALAPAPNGQLSRDDILGDYKILRLIAVGGMGEIYEARQISLDRSVALKVMRKDRASSGAQTRFLRERAVLAKLHQTNIVPVYAAGREGEIEYFAMQYIEGATLCHVLQSLRHGPVAAPSGAAPPLISLVGSLVRKGTPDTGLTTCSIVGESTRVDAPNADHPMRLSLAYWRSVTAALAEAADAIDFAHQHGIIHRDLKPSNLMLDRAGRCHVIDFGLANIAEQPHHAIQSQTEGAVGTPYYMAPEQFEGKFETRSDIWGLGMVLHEMLTLRRPFPGDARQALSAPEKTMAKPHELTTLPADLAAICAKSLHRNVDGRYPTAKALAADLRHWLHFEPTMARGARPLRRVGLWARRNPGWAGMIATCAVACLLFFFYFSHIREVQAEERVQGEKDKAEIRSKLEQARADDAITMEERQSAERKVLFQQLRAILMDRRADDSEGWSQRALLKAQEASKWRIDVELRSMAAAGLQGLDAKLDRRFAIPASSVAFDQKNGKELAIGGLPSLDGKPAIPARLWDGSLNQPSDAGLANFGPVTFDDRNRPLQLVFKDERTPVLWNLADRKLHHEFKKTDVDLKELHVFALAENGKSVAAAFALKNGKYIVVVWEVGNDKPLKLELAAAATSLSLSPDGKLLAAGGADGKTRVWALPQTEPIADLFTDRAEVTALTFGRDIRRHAGKRNPGTGWLLAAGAAGGIITIWDMHSLSVRSLCRGYAQNHVHAVAFSPDGMTLASAGRGSVHLWDLSTGSLLLRIGEANFLTGIVFSPDGERLSIGSIPAFGAPGRVSIWRLSRERGIHSCRGMATTIQKTTFSPDSRYVAALAMDSRIGVWELKTDRLLHIFDAPKSVWTDNAGICFSPDGKQLAYSSAAVGGEATATVWEVESGKELNTWKYDGGLNNILAYHPNKKLLLFQVQRANEKTVGCIYNLKENGQTEKLVTISEFTSSIDFPRMPADGSFVVMVGYDAANGSRGRTIRAFDSTMGKVIWTTKRETVIPGERHYLGLDRGGRFLTISRALGSTRQSTLVELPAGQLLNADPPWFITPAGWGPEMPYRVDSVDQANNGRSALVPRDGTKPVIILDLDLRSSGSEEFSPNGQYYALGNKDGTVSIFDIEMVQRKLTEIGLGW